MESEESGPLFRNVNATKSEQIQYRLPDEEILSRLPVKSLLRFRCVSKSWRSLIDSKRFIKIHLDISKRNSDLTHHRIFNLNSSNSSLRHLSLYSLINEPLPVTDSFNLDVQICCSSSIVGCCDGLICFLIDQMHFPLCNPSTRMTKQLPALDDNSEQVRVLKYGFGFDEATGDYKVLAIFNLSRNRSTTHRDKSIGKVYSLKTNSWRTLENWDGDRPIGPGKLVNGRLHWIIDFKIQSFDLKSEAFGIVERPFCTKDVFHASLGVLDGCLCVIYDYRGIKSEFWILKKYGASDSWNKVVTVPYDHRCLKRSLLTAFIAPLYIGPNREILFACGNTYIIYYPEDNRYLFPQINNLDVFHGGNVYIESLVSLVPDGEGE